MKKFLSISVCVLASLTANAGIKMTKASDGKDSIYVDGAFNEGEVVSALQGLTGNQSSVLKIATAKSYGLSENDWSIICDKIISNIVYTVDLTDTRLSEQLGTNGDLFGGKLTNYSNNNVNTVTWSRYANVPASCFQNKSKIVSITIPDQKKGEENAITIGHDAFQGMAALETLYIGSCVTSIGENICQNDSKLLKVSFKTPQIKVLPAHSFQNCTSLQLIDLPNNVEEIGEGAFECCSLQTITLPNTLKTIRRNAFHDCDLTYVVIPENVELIETEAFQQNRLLKDVYVMGSKAKCQENGFSKEQNNNNFENTSEKGNTPDNPATREDWKSEDKTPVVLHFVATDENGFRNYENPYWVMLNTEGILDELKACDSNESKEQFVQKYGLHKEFPSSLYQYATGTSSSCPFAYITYKDNQGKVKTIKNWRKENGYYSDSNMAKTLDNDYVGWKQFLLIQDDAKQNVFVDENRVDDRWYSMCFPFDMTAKQIRTAYGAGTEVCEFLGIWDSKKLNENGNKIVTFRFKPLLSEKDAKDDEIITMANRSFMIHPASKKESEMNTTVWTRIIPNISKDDQSTAGKTLISTIPERAFSMNELLENSKNDEELIKGFEFVGNYDKEKKLPAESNYFAYRENQDGSHTLILNHLTKESRHTWTPMTALVRPYDQGASTQLYAKKLDFSFTLEKNDETTGIEDIHTEAVRQNTTANNRIYSLSGQMVKEGTSLEGLSRGIYIVNGKKIVVK